jgi:hypothetical protein
MATERQIVTNRANSKKSSGPKTRAGKRRASKNAYRHGLSARTLVDSEWTANVEELAHEIVDSTVGQIGLFRARLIAEAQCELERVQSTATAVVRQILAECDDIGRTASLADHSQLAVDSEDTAEAVQRALPLLRMFDRYERRLRAKRNRAIKRCFEGYLEIGSLG